MISKKKFYSVFLAVALLLVLSYFGGRALFRSEKSINPEPEKRTEEKTEEPTKDLPVIDKLIKPEVIIKETATLIVP